MKPDDDVMDVDDLTLMPKPIADLFQHTTVLFADIAGFTSWTSKREPEQVFSLLQTLFNTFDMIAKKRWIFKLETIGDCYLTVTGLPEPQDDHAVRITKFARECLFRTKSRLARLYTTLGPGTVNLEMRFGLHTGPVTADVLQGEKSRFQLFGDTVNTASRMESNGENGRIHVSKSTAEHLVEAGKGHWLEKREDPTYAKGKGLLEYFWIVRSTRTLSHRRGRRGSGDNADSERFSDSELNASSFTSHFLTSKYGPSDTSESNWSVLAADSLALYDSCPHIRQLPVVVMRT